MSWTEITTQAGADSLLQSVNGFHDACLREANLLTGHWVDESLSMTCPGHLDQQLRLLIQRQANDPCAVELLFDELTRFHLVPSPEKYESIISSATLLVREGMIYWSPVGDWDPTQSNRDECTWISSPKLQWRPVDYLGPELRYGPRDSDPS